MKTLFLLLFSVLILTGCATSKIIYDSEGNEAHLNDCSGTALNWGLCQTKASEICQARGYAILNNDSSTGVMTLPDGYGGTNSFATATRLMLIRCK